MELAVFQEKLATLDHFAGRLMVMDPNEKTVYLRHAPEKVAEHVTRSLSPVFTTPPVPDPTG